MAVHQQVNVDTGIGQLGGKQRPPFVPAFVVREQSNQSRWPAVVALVVAFVEARRAVNQNDPGADKRHESGGDKEEGNANILLQGLGRHNAAGDGLEARPTVESAQQRREEPQRNGEAQEVSVAHPAFRGIEKF